MSNTLTRRSLPGFEDFGTPMSLFQDTLNRFFSEPQTARPWAPAVDIKETENELILTADIPGIQLEDIDLRLEDGTLTLSGQRKFEKEEKQAGYHRIERSFGTFARSFALPDTIDTENVGARYDNGVLTVSLPKKEIAKPKSIKVQVAPK